MLITILQVSVPALALIIVQLIISAKQQRLQDVKFELTIKEIKEDIKRLENKQDKHNDLIERVTKLEMKDEAQWRWIDEFKDKK
jgi:predicted nuclease with TOPRIM domain